MTIKLYYSNDIHTLGEQLAADMASVKRDPLEPVTVFVPNPYMREWLMMRLASLTGIVANIDFEFLNSGLRELIVSMDGSPVGDGDLLERKDLRLLIYHVLAAARPGHKEALALMSYLAGSDGVRSSDFERRAWQLADRLASLFLRYEEHRPELVQAWATGKLLYKSDMERAQSFVWRQVFAKKPGVKDAYDKMTLPQYAASVDIEGSCADLPPVFLFCETQLSRFHGELIARLGAKTDIYIYQINPCWEYWEDIATPSEERWQRIRSLEILEDRDGECLELDEYENRLLQLWGKAGREDVRLMSMLEEALTGEGLFESHWRSRSVPGEKGTLLSTLQSRVLNRRGRVTDGRIGQDTSLQVAACPSLFREVESVYNSILFNLETDPELKMTDIAVFVPDMEQYGPVVKSVFFRDESALSFSIIDYSAFTESFAGRVLLSILDCAAGDLTRSLVFSLFSNPCFQKAWGISNDTVDLWLHWADNLNIFRSAAGGDESSGYAVFSWSHGLKRLRFGRIFEPRSSSEAVTCDYQGIAPYEDMNSSDAEALGLFSTAYDLLHVTVRGMTGRTAGAAEWASVINGLMRDFIAIPDDYPGERTVIENIQQSMRELAVLDGLAGGKAELTLAFIREYLQDGLRGMPGFHGRYLTSGVNVSSLVPRRQIPFKVVYVLGMGEGIFPGAAEASSLDLMAEKRRIGDLTTPDLNSYLFLNILMSTQKKCYLSYVARDLQKDQDLYANSLVHQLVSYIDEHLVQGFFKTITVPLNGFSPVYPGDDAGPPGSDFISLKEKSKTRVVNYSIGDMAMLAKKLHESGAKVPDALVHFLKQDSGFMPMRPSVEGNETAQTVVTEAVTIHELKNYLYDPASASIRRHLHLYDSDDENTLEQDDEPLYSEYYIKNDILSKAVETYLVTGSADRALESAAGAYRSAALQGIVPEGAFGRLEQGALLDQFRLSLEGTPKKPGIRQFLQEHGEHSFLRGISLGMHSDRQAAVTFAPAPCTFFNKTCEIKGQLPFLWLDKQTGIAETLVFTMASTLQLHHLLKPFLFYLAAAGGLSDDLHELMGKGGFMVHVALRDSIESFSYKLKKDESRNLMTSIVRDYLDDTLIEHMPLSVVFARGMQQPHEMSPSAAQHEKDSYRDSFMQALKGEEESSYSLYRPDRIVSIARPGVPHDVYDRVCSRFSIFSRSLVKGGE